MSNEKMAAIHDERILEEMYGPLYPYSDHKRGERIRFHDPQGQMTGTILWVCLPQKKAGYHLPMQYIVELEKGDIAAIVHHADVIE